MTQYFKFWEWFQIYEDGWPDMSEDRFLEFTKKYMAPLADIVWKKQPNREKRWILHFRVMRGEYDSQDLRDILALG
jgi:hypothetical protein